MKIAVIALASFVAAAAPAAAQGGVRGLAEDYASPMGKQGMKALGAGEPTGNVIVQVLGSAQADARGVRSASFSVQAAAVADVLSQYEVVMESLPPARVSDAGGDQGFQVVSPGPGKTARALIDEVKRVGGDAVLVAEEETMEFPVREPNDPNHTNQYHHTNMQDYEAWDLHTGLSSITVGICDTGLQLDHPDLAGNKLEGYHATTQTWEDDGGDVSAVHPHGTMCAGCAAAIGNNGEGVAGVAWNIMHRPGRVSDSSSGGASSAVLADCARKMCELSDVKVASVSYSGVEGATRRSAATYCKEQGALMVNAAGNDGRDLTDFGDSEADDLIVAGATASSDNMSSFSAFGAFVDVFAPGTAVWTTTTNSGYAPVSGTSFSCPLVAGLLALIWSQDPALTPDQVEAFLKEGTQMVGDLDSKGTRYGRINSFRSLEAAGSGTAFPTASPTTPPPTHAPTPCPSDNTVVVEVKTDNYPGESSWILEDLCDTNHPDVEGGSYTGQGTTYDHPCLLTGARKKFTMMDSFGDGMCCSFGQGHFKVFDSGEEVFQGAEFDSEVSKEWGSCDAPNPPTPPPVPSPTIPPVTPTTPPSPSPTTPPSPSPTTPPSPSPTTPPVPSPTTPPVPSPTTPPVNPPPNTSVIDIHLFTLRFSFTPMDACYDDSLDGPTGVSPGQCAQACAVMASCAGFQMTSDGCVLAGASPPAPPCSGAPTTFYDRSAAMHFDE